MNKLGFIGMGNMATALAGGFIGGGAIAPENVYAYDPAKEMLEEKAARYGFNAVSSLAELAEAADTLLVACKPYHVEGALHELGGSIAGKALISIAAGKSYDWYAPRLPEGTRFQFVMPNTPAMVGEGVFLFEDTNSLDADERKEIMDMFSSAGIVEELPSSQMGIGMAISGCGPAFVDLFIEAYADAAVKYGMQRATAYKLVEKTLLGSAKLALETGKHPGVLKDEVCSPGGTTIRGVASLEESGFRAACIKSIDAIQEIR